MTDPTLKLTETQSAMVDQLVRSGRFDDAGDVVEAALGLLLEHEADDAKKLATLRRAVDAGLADLDAGRSETFDDPDQLRTRLTSLSETAARR